MIVQILYAQSSSRIDSDCKAECFFLSFFAPLKGKTSDRMFIWQASEGWCLFYLNCHLPFLKSTPCPIPPSWYQLVCIQVDDAASHFFVWAADGPSGWCMGTDLGKLSISYCFNRSSFNHLDGFHLEVLNSIIRHFAVRKNQVRLTMAKQKSGSARSLLESRKEDSKRCLP